MAKTWLEITLQDIQSAFFVQVEDQGDWRKTVEAFAETPLSPQFVVLDTLNMGIVQDPNAPETIPMAFSYYDIKVICPHLGESPVKQIKEAVQAQKAAQGQGVNPNSAPNSAPQQDNTPPAATIRKLSPEERVRLLTAGRELTAEELAAVKEST